MFGGDATPTPPLAAERRLRGGRRTLANDDLAGTVPSNPEARSALAPLVVEGRVRGALWSMRLAADRPFGVADMTLLGDIGGQGGIAVDRAQTADREGRQRARVDALLRVTVALNEAGSLDALMTALADAAVVALGVDRAEVHAFDDTQTHTIASGYHGFVYPADHAGAVDIVPPVAIPAEAEVIRTRRPLVRPADSPFISPFLIDGWRGDVIVPLVAADAAQGVLYVWSHEHARDVPDDEIELLQAIGHQAGLAILRARDAETARRRAEHLALLNQTGRALSASIDMDDLCTTLHAEVGQVLAADAFFVGIYYDESVDEIWFPYMVDLGRIYRGERLPVNDGPSGRVVRTHRSYVLARDGEQDQTAAARSSFGDVNRPSQSALYAPMLRGDHLIGLLSVQRYDPGAYDDDDLRTLETLAQQAAAAFAHAQLYVETVAGKDAAERQAANLVAVLETTRAIAAQTDLTQTLGVLADHLERLLPTRRSQSFASIGRPTT